MADLAIVLSGGSALGAYQAGAYCRLQKAGFTPGRVAGTSVGAINAAIICGNRPDDRAQRLEGFWNRAASTLSWLPLPLGGSWFERMGHLGSALGTRLFGRGPLFRPRFPGMLSILPGLPHDVSTYDLAPLRRLLGEFVDFGLLNSGDIRAAFGATDLETGDPVFFDTAHEKIGVEHILASTAFIPDFPPVAIGDRLFGDGGLSANVPIGAILDEKPAGDMVCVVLDLFARSAPRPINWLDAMERQSELLFGNQTYQILKRYEAEHGCRTASPRLAVLRFEHRPAPNQRAMKTFDYSREALEKRWSAGASDIDAAVDILEAEMSTSADDADRPSYRLYEFP